MQHRAIERERERGGRERVGGTIRWRCSWWQMVTEVAREGERKGAREIERDRERESARV